MSTLLTRVRRTGRKAGPDEKEPKAPKGAKRARQEPAPPSPRPEAPTLDIAPNDPILVYLQDATGPVDVESLQLDSPALEAMRASGLKLVVPLVSQGELIGLLNLGPRLSEQDYSGDDRKLLENLAAQAAPAVRVAQLVRQQQAEARDRERMVQELHVAQLIQQNFLPRELPKLSGWEVAAYYRPARAVGGDFYDFIELEGGAVAFVIGDVTDKGVPAALVMAATRTVLRASAQRLVSPGEVLARVNDVLVDDIPPNMFVTCLYGILEPATGAVRFANAGHNLPYVRTDDGVIELRATGMPLGLMSGMSYEGAEGTLEPGQTLLLSSDGLVEAHSPDGEMFGFPRLKEDMAARPGGPKLLDDLLNSLEAFTGPGWEQEDDVTLVAIQRTGSMKPLGAEEGQTEVARFSLPSEEGQDREAAQRVGEAVAGLGLPPARMEKLKTAVAEATMNAMEHGNKYRADLPVDIVVSATPADVTVQITDRGSHHELPEAETPDIEAKLAGEQTPRGWGLFLIKNMVDEMRVSGDESHHTIELVIRREEPTDGA